MVLLKSLTKSNSLIILFWFSYQTCWMLDLDESPRIMGSDNSNEFRNGRRSSYRNYMTNEAVHPSRYSRYRETETVGTRMDSEDVVDDAAGRITRALELDPRRNKLDLSVETIPTPDLTPEEEALPEAQKQLRILVKKCQTVNCFNFFDVNQLVQYLSVSTIPSIMSEESAAFQHGSGPHEFYLSWFSDTDKILLLNRWLTQEVLNQCIPDLDAETLNGNLVR